MQGYAGDVEDFGDAFLFSRFSVGLEWGCGEEFALGRGSYVEADWDGLNWTDFCFFRELELGHFLQARVGRC
jgi:hypothetical protein